MTKSQTTIHHTQHKRQQKKRTYQGRIVLNKKDGHGGENSNFHIAAGAQPPPTKGGGWFSFNWSREHNLQKYRHQTKADNVQPKKNNPPNAGGKKLSVTLRQGGTRQDMPTSIEPKNQKSKTHQSKKKPPKRGRRWKGSPRPGLSRAGNK